MVWYNGYINQQKGFTMDKAEIEEIKDIRRRSMISLERARVIRGIIEDCRQLSSGTIASLIKESDYSAIGTIHNEFITYAKEVGPKASWDNWHDAWRAFCFKKFLGC